MTAGMVSPMLGGGFCGFGYSGGKVVSPTYRPLLLPPSPRRYSWYSFLLEAESIPGP